MRIIRNILREMFILVVKIFWIMVYIVVFLVDLIVGNILALIEIVGDSIDNFVERIKK